MPEPKHSTDIAYCHEKSGWHITKADSEGVQDIILATLDVPATGCPDLSDDEQRANGTLWAAAPKMLAALKTAERLLADAGFNPVPGLPLARIRAVIAEAEGK